MLRNIDKVFIFPATTETCCTRWDFHWLLCTCETYLRLTDLNTSVNSEVSKQFIPYQYAEIFLHIAYRFDRLAHCCSSIVRVSKTLSTLYNTDVSLGSRESRCHDGRPLLHHICSGVTSTAASCSRWLPGISTSPYHIWLLAWIDIGNRSRGSWL